MKTSDRMMSPEGGRRFFHNGSVSSKEGMAMIKSVLSGGEPTFDIVSDDKD
jgi:hypothetical protein